MFARGRSKDRSSRKPTPPQASYMDSNQFANYLSELREKRVTRPGGSKTPGASSARTSIDPASSAARTPAATSTTTVNTTAAPPYPRADSALSNRTTTTTLSHAPTRPSMSTSRSRRSMPPPASPRERRESMNIDPTIVQPSATYIERGTRWMEREEAESLRDALEDMDAIERAKADAAALAAEKLSEEQMEEEERIQMAAQREASELVFAHIHPEEVKRRAEEEERRRQTGYRYHLRKGSYQQVRAASVGREYKGDDAIVVDLSRPSIGTRTFSDESTMRSASRTSMRRESSDSSSRPYFDSRQSMDEMRGRATEKKSGKSYGTLSSTISGVASKSRSWSARRKSGGKRNISGEVNTVFHPDQIWEEPESSRESSKNRSKKEKDAQQTKEDIYNHGLQPLSPLKTRNPVSRVQFANEKEGQRSPSTTPTLEFPSLPVQKIDRFEIFRNPPSQSRNPLYTANNPPPPRMPSPDKSFSEVPMKEGKEIRNEELRKATTKSLKDRSEKLPTPTAVSDRLGRPIVSFDKAWAPAEEKAKEKALLDKNKADVCPPVSASRAKLSEPQAGGSAGTGTISAIEAAKRKIFGFKAEEQVGDKGRVGERTSRSQERRSGDLARLGTAGKGQGKSGPGGEKGPETQREGYFEASGGQANSKHELGKASDAIKVNDAAAGSEVTVKGKWVVETKGGKSTFRVEGEKEMKEQQARKDGFPYRPDESSASSSTTSLPAVVKDGPVSTKSSKESTPRTSLSQDKEEVANDTTPIATPLANLVQKPVSAPPSEPIEEATEPLSRTIRTIVSIAPPAAATRPPAVERTPTLMSRSPFARPRGQSFTSTRSIFAPEKSVPASPVRSSTSTTENVKPQPIGPSLLSAARPRPSFLTRTRSRSSVAGHSVFALRKAIQDTAPSSPTGSSIQSAEAQVPATPEHKSPESAVIEGATASLETAETPFKPISRALPSPPSQTSADEASLPDESGVAAPIKATDRETPARHITNSHLSAARPRPSFLTRTRSRSSVAGHSPFLLKAGEPSSPSPESSSPTVTAHEEDRPPFARSKSSETSAVTTPARQSLDGPPIPRFPPRSPFARPSLGPTSLSTPTEMSLNKTGSVASRSPFGRPGSARTTASTTSVPSRLSNDITSSGSVRRSPFDRPATSHGHARSSLGSEARKSIDQDQARPDSRHSMSSSPTKAKLPWMRSANKPASSAQGVSELRHTAKEGSRAESPAGRPVSREKDLPWLKTANTASQPEKILADEPIVDSPPALEITVNTADIIAMYQDVIDTPTKPSSEVVVNTSDMAEQYNLVLNESHQRDEKASIPAPAVSKASEPVIEKKSSLSGARPLPMRPSGPRQSAPSTRRFPRETPVAPPALPKAETLPERAMPPPVVVEPVQQKPGHAKKSSISAPLVSAPVLAPPTETLSEVRPPAPEEAMMDVKPLPTIYGPPRTDTPPGFSMHPPTLSISGPPPSIAVMGPPAINVSEAPMISVSGPPAISVSGSPAINVSSAPAIAISAPPSQQATRPLPQPTRPLPTPSSSARPLPRPSSSSGRPLPAPANARPLPNPSSRVQPPPNHARPSSDSTSHWSPAPAPVGARATATCHSCSLPIEGRVIALAGLSERWHPACMQCHVCSTALADFEISPEPEFARKARVARIEARENGDYVAEGEATDGDKRLRFYCHLDWHEAFAPRCMHCKTPIIGEHITALGGKHYHYGHFFCCECGDPFGAGKPHVELEGYAWCTGCMEKRTERRAPRCGLCRRNVVGEVVSALGKEFHAECFRCGDCRREFVGGEIYLRDDVGVCCRECMERWAKR